MDFSIRDRSIAHHTNRLLRFALAADTALSAIILPIIIVGAACAGFIGAALAFTGMLVGGALVYSSYWRRHPLGK